MLITFLASIVSDPNARAAFIENPGEAMKQAGLSDAHKALLRTAATAPGHDEALGAAITAELVTAVGPIPAWPGPAFHLTSAAPDSAPSGTSTKIRVVGTYFEEGITIALTLEKASYPGVVTNLVTGAQSSMDATFNLTAAAPGLYQLTATNPAGARSSLDFTITGASAAA